MPFAPILYNVFELLDVNNDSTGFTLDTLATSGVRQFRLAMSTIDSLGRPVESFYFFSADFSGFALLSSVTIKIPFRKSLFVSDTNATIDSLVPTFEDVLTLQDVKGDKMTAGIFKLYHWTLSTTSADVQNQVPLQIDLKATYQVGTIFVRFIYYRILSDGNGNQYTFYTGVYGDKSYSNEYAVLPGLDATLLQPTTPKVTTKTIGGIQYFFVRTNNTPNIVVLNGISTPGSQQIDTYSDDKYKYTLTSSSKNLLAGGNASMTLVIKDKTTDVQVFPDRLRSTNDAFNISANVIDSDVGINIDITVDKKAPASAFFRVLAI